MIIINTMSGRESSPLIPLYLALAACLALVTVAGCRSKVADGSGWITLSDPQAGLVLWLPAGCESEQIAGYSGRGRVMVYRTPGGNIQVTIVPAQTDVAAGGLDMEQQTLIEATTNNGQQQVDVLELGQRELAGAQGPLTQFSYVSEDQPHWVLLYSFVHPNIMEPLSVAVEIKGDCAEFANCERAAWSIIEGLRSL